MRRPRPLEVLATVGVVLAAAAVLRVSGAPAGTDRTDGRPASRSESPGFRLSRTRIGFLDRDGAMRRLLSGVRALPGVESAALSARDPQSGNLVCAIAGNAGREPVTAGLARVSPEYFRTMRIPLRGRDFAARDDGSAPPVVIVNETLARRLWPAGDPIGRRLRLAGPDEPMREVVGVVRDRASNTPTERRSGLVYLPDRQAPAAGEGRLSLVVRTTQDAPSLREPLSQLVEAVDPELPVGAVDLDFTPHAPIE